jgi:hypothetical protein
MDRYYYSALIVILGIAGIVWSGLGEPEPALIVKQYYWKTENGTVQQTGAGRPTEKSRIEAWLVGSQKIGNAVEKYNGQTVAIMAEPLDANGIEVEL